MAEPPQPSRFEGVTAAHPVASAHPTAPSLDLGHRERGQLEPEGGQVQVEMPTWSEGLGAPGTAAARSSDDTATGNCAGSGAWRVELHAPTPCDLEALYTRMSGPLGLALEELHVVDSGGPRLSELAEQTGAPLAPLSESAVHAVELAVALLATPCLRTLDLQFANLQRGGDVGAVAAALESLPSLTSLRCVTVPVRDRCGDCQCSSCSGLFLLPLGSSSSLCSSSYAPRHQDCFIITRRSASEALRLWLWLTPTGSVAAAAAASTIPHD
jgi:hypothetical protein